MNGRRIWAVMSESFWILLVALVALFVFLLALGAYSPGEVLTLTIVMVVLFLLWLGHAILRVAARGQARPARDRGARAPRVLGVLVDGHDLGVELARRAALLVRAEARALDAAEGHVDVGAGGLGVDVEDARLGLLDELLRGGEARW